MPGLVGMHRDTGKKLDGYNHLIQSLRDIWTTQIGTRVMRRDYGIIRELIDRPMNSDLIIDTYVALITSANRWEPRWRTDRIYVVDAQPGEMTLDVDGFYRPDGRPLTLQGIQI